MFPKGEGGVFWLQVWTPLPSTHAVFKRRNDQVPRSDSGNVRDGPENGDQEIFVK